MSSIVRRSASRICSVLSTRMGRVERTACARLRSNAARTSGRSRQARVKGAVYVNGTITPADEAVIPVYDHGFLYGEGVYETLRTYNRVPFLYDRHMRRLRASAAALHLDVPFDDDSCAAGSTTRPWRRLPTLRARARGLHPHPAHARRRRTELRPEGHARAVARHHRQALRGAARARVRRGHHDLARVGPPQPPGSVNPIIKSNNLLNNALAMQEAHRTRRRRGADVQLPRRAVGVLAVELLPRARRRRADADVGVRPARGPHARVPVRGRPRRRRAGARKRRSGPRTSRRRRRRSSRARRGS